MTVHSEKSDHTIIEFEIEERSHEGRDENHKINRRNYVKANYSDLKLFFNGIDLKTFNKI